MSLLALFPDDNTFLLARLNVLRDLGRREERTEAARRQVLRKDADPLFAHHYAQAILPDPSRLDEAERLMRRAVRQRPYAPAGYYILGNVLWEQRRFQEATDLYRFAAVAGGPGRAVRRGVLPGGAGRRTGAGGDALPQGPVRADRGQGGRPGAGHVLRPERTRRDGVGVRGAGGVLVRLRVRRRRRAEPARSRRGDAVRGRDADQLQRPGGRPGAPGRRPGRWPRAPAGCGRRPGRPWSGPTWPRPAGAGRSCSATTHWPPTSTATCRAPSPTWKAGPRPSPGSRAMCDRFPFHYPLQQLLIDWLRGEPASDGEPSPAEPVIRRLIDLCPDDAWARRELALHLANHGRAAEALHGTGDWPGRLEPDSPSYFYTLGHALNRDDRPGRGPRGLRGSRSPVGGQRSGHRRAVRPGPRATRRRRRSSSSSPTS